MPFLAGAAIGRLDAGDEPHQRGLAGAVRADERYAVAAFDVERHVVEHHLVAVGLPHVREIEHDAAALGRRRELEVDALAFGRHLDAFDLLEHLDAALHLRPSWPGSGSGR
jgi:hypothetical protein